MDDEKLYFTASDISISENTSNNIFLIITMRIQSTRANGNHEGVTEAFIDEIINNPDKYKCQPQYVDIEKLRNKCYNSLGHMYNAVSKTFNTTQVGSFFNFEKVSDEYGISLFGEARIPKRQIEVCRAIVDLYRIGLLNFSFEINYVKSDTIYEDGVQYIDSSENNSLTGVAIVSVPAYTESTAIALVAEKTGQTDQTDRDMTQTGDNNKGVDEVMNIDEAMKAISEKDQRIAELEKQVSDFEAKTDEMTKEKDALEQESKAKDETLTESDAARKKCAEDLTRANEALTEKDQRITELESKVTELEAAKNELDQMKAAQAASEMEAKKERAKCFAQKQGLDVEDNEVSSAIASLDYEKIAELAMKSENATESKVVIASFIGTDINKSDEYDGLLSRR